MQRRPCREVGAFLANERGWTWPSCYGQPNLLALLVEERLQTTDCGRWKPRGQQQHICPFHVPQEIHVREVELLLQPVGHTAVEQGRDPARSCTCSGSTFLHFGFTDCTANRKTFQKKKKKGACERTL